MEAGGWRGRRTGDLAVDRLISLGLGERLVDVRRKRRFARRLAVELEDPPALAERLDELDGTESLTGAQAARRASQRFPPTSVELLHEQHLDRRSRRAAQVQPRGHDTRVVHDHEPVTDDVGKI